MYFYFNMPDAPAPDPQNTTPFKPGAVKATPAAENEAGDTAVPFPVTAKRPVLAIVLGGVSCILLIFVFVLRVQLTDRNETIVQIKNRSDQLQDGTGKIQAQADEAKAGSSALQKQLTETKTELAQSKTELNIIKAASGEIQSQLDKARATSTEFQTQMAEAKVASIKHQGEVEVAQAQAAVMQTQWTKAKTDLGQLEAQLVASKAEVADLQSKLEKAQTEIVRLQKPPVKN